MFKNIIKQYINSISVSDVIMFGHRENIMISNNEASLIVRYIKDNWESILYNNLDITLFLKNNFNKEKALKINKLFIEYKKKYQNYL